MPDQLFLQPHVFLSRGKRHWVILDVNRDKYLCVDRRQFESLGPSLKGWVNDSDGYKGAVGEVPGDALGLADQLLGQGILSERGADAKDALATVYPLPVHAVDPDSSSPSRWSLWVHARSFFRSCARANRELSEQPFRATIEAVRARKARNTGHAGGFDQERAQALVAIFAALRLFYPRSYLCLFDSLALLHFLARQQVYPDWVFGVNADPFEAHCWVQAGKVVLNDRVERVSGFTPIMIV